MFYSSCHFRSWHIINTGSVLTDCQSHSLMLLLSSPDISLSYGPELLTPIPRSLTLSGQVTQVTKSSQASFLASHWTTHGSWLFRMFGTKVVQLIKETYKAHLVVKGREAWGRRNQSKGYTWIIKCGLLSSRSCY